MEIFNWKTFWNFLGGAVILFIIIFLGTLVTRTTFASDKINYCIAESTNLYVLDSKGVCTSKKENGMCNEVAGFKLVGHVDYRSDHTLGYYYAMDDLIQSAKKLECTLNTK